MKWLPLFRSQRLRELLVITCCLAGIVVSASHCKNFTGEEKTHSSIYAVPIERRLKEFPPQSNLLHTFAAYLWCEENSETLAELKDFVRNSKALRSFSSKMDAQSSVATAINSCLESNDCVNAVADDFNNAWAFAQRRCYLGKDKVSDYRQPNFGSGLHLTCNAQKILAHEGNCLKNKALSGAISGAAVGAIGCCGVAMATNFLTLAMPVLKLVDCAVGYVSCLVMSSVTGGVLGTAVGVAACEEKNKPVQPTMLTPITSHKPPPGDPAPTESKNDKDCKSP